MVVICVRRVCSWVIIVIVPPLPPKKGIDLEEKQRV